MAVELTTDVRKNLRDGLIRGVKRAVSGDPGNTIAGQPVPEFLAGPEPSGPLPAWQHRSGRAVCDRWARRDRKSILPGQDIYLRQLCDPYLGSNMPDPPTTAPPFTGGQCDLTVYQCLYRETRNGGVEWINANFKTYGPVKGFRTEVQGTRYKGFVTSRGGISGSSCAVGMPAPGPLMERQQFDIAVVPVRDGGAFSITGLCSGLDNCGDPDPVFNPGDGPPTPNPNPGPVGGPTGYPFPDFDIDISPEGDIIIDFGDGSGPTTIDPTDPDGDGGGGGGGGAPTTPGSPGGGGSTGGGGESEGEAPDGQELTGVLVTVISAPPNANKMDNVSAVIYRGAGYVSMGYPGLLGVDTSGAVLESPQFFHAQQRGLTAWRVRANVGFNLETIPYYRETEA